MCGTQTRAGFQCHIANKVIQTGQSFTRGCLTPVWKYHRMDIINLNTLNSLRGNSKLWARQQLFCNHMIWVYLHQVKMAIYGYGSGYVILGGSSVEMCSKLWQQHYSAETELFKWKGAVTHRTWDTSILFDRGAAGCHLSILHLFINLSRDTLWHWHEKSDMKTYVHRFASRLWSHSHQYNQCIQASGLHTRDSHL